MADLEAITSIEEGPSSLVSLPVDNGETAVGV